MSNDNNNNDGYTKTTIHIPNNIIIFPFIIAVAQFIM